METLTCPIDGRHCEESCPEGGCHLTTAVELGAKIIDFGGGTVGFVFTPSGDDFTKGGNT